MRMDVNFSESTQSFATKMDGLDQKFDANFEHTQEVTVVNGTPYKGPYEVTPRVVGQTMETRNKVMTDDVTIRAIPVYRTSNQSGGTTVYIANEV